MISQKYNLTLGTTVHCFYNYLSSYNFIFIKFKIDNIQFSVGTSQGICDSSGSLFYLTFIFIRYCFLTTNIMSFN